MQLGVVQPPFPPKTEQNCTRSSASCLTYGPCCSGSLHIAKFHNSNIAGGSIFAWHYVEEEAWGMRVATLGEESGTSSSLLLGWYPIHSRLRGLGLHVFRQFSQCTVFILQLFSTESRSCAPTELCDWEREDVALSVDDELLTCSTPGKSWVEGAFNSFLTFLLARCSAGVSMWQQPQMLNCSPGHCTVKWELFFF